MKTTSRRIAEVPVLNSITRRRDQMLIGFVEKTKFYYARWFKKHKTEWKQTVASLKNFPPQSLGNDLGVFLEKGGFDLMPKLEEHDVIHVLLNLETTVKGEAMMQFFLLGNGKKSFYALATALAAALLVPEHSGAFVRAFHRGRNCRNISRWDFEHLLGEPTELLRRLMARKKSRVEAPLF